MKPRSAFALPLVNLPAVRPVPLITLTWLLRLRWGAVAGQLVTVLVASVGLGLALPVVPLVSVVLLTAVTNALLWRRLRQPPEPSPQLAAALLVLDTLLLTTLLALSGGPANPFSAIYVLHVTLAVVVLGAVWGAAVLVLAIVCYSALFLWHWPLPHAAALDGPAWQLHMAGNWLAFVISGAIITYFLARISAELRLREAELAEVQEQMARRDKLASLSTLAAGAAHELGTPLATIAVVAKEMARAAERLDGGAMVAQDALLIRDQVERCRGILVQMSAKAGENAGEAPTDLQIVEVVDAVREALGADLASRFDTRLDPDAARLVAPRAALVHVIVSLVRNAFDASSDTGRVRLVVEPAGADLVRLMVLDAGHGMAPDVLRRAGDPFFTTKPPGRGTGLGLFLAQAFADGLGGSLVLDSEEGRGTRAVLELPLDRPHRAGRAA